MSGDGVEHEVEPTIEERLRTVCGHLNVLHAQLVELAAEALSTGTWQGNGIRSLAHWLTWQAGISPGRAHEVVRLAEAHATHPVTMAAFADGAISLDQAAVAATVPAHLDPTFADHAQVATVTQLRVMARAARPAPPSPAPSDAQPESVRTWFDDDGRYHLTADLDPDRGRIVDAAMSAARDALFEHGHHHLSWADALVEVAQRSLDASPQARRERFRVNWFLDPTNPVPAHWQDGIAVPDWLRDHLLCDATIAPTFTAGAHPVSVGTTQRSIPDRTRRLVLHRDKHCRAPGCAQTRWLHIHHLVHREHGGGHDTTNLVALCPTHHRQHHRGQLGITGDPDASDGLSFTDAKGRVIDPAAHPTKPTRPPPAPGQPYRHPLGERLQHWALMYPDPPDEHAA